MKTRLILIPPIVTLIIAATPLSAEVQYNLIDLGEGVAYGINNSGQVVGYSGTFPSNMRPTLFDSSGSGYDIELGDEGTAYSINQIGQIVGTSGGRAILFDPTGKGENTDLGPGIAYSINNFGQIVGTSRPIFGRATLFDPTGGGENIDLGTLGGPDSGAYSINDHGQIVGWARPDYGWIHATLFDPTGGGQNINLDALGSGALSINNCSQIVGNTWFASDDSHATLFDHTGAGDNLDLGTLDGLESYAYSINNKGQIVGYASYILLSDSLAVSYDTAIYSSPVLFKPDYDPRSFSSPMYLKADTIIIDPNIPDPSFDIVYRAILFNHTGNGDNIALDDLIDPNLGWTLNTALCINDNGYIVGFGTNPDAEEHAYLLTPTSEPLIEAEIEINPKILNLKSKGKWITCHIWLPEEYDVADVNSYRIFLQGELEAEWVWFNEQQQVVAARFNRSAVQEILMPGEVELTVTGELTDGTKFTGMDTVRVISTGRTANRKAKR